MSKECRWWMAAAMSRIMAAASENRDQQQYLLEPYNVHRYQHAK